MAKIVGAGETIVDLIFKNGEPQKAVPGGSVFNALVSAKHAGADVLFVSETGKDKVGRIVLDFLIKNGISTDYIYLYDEVNTPVSMAFLNDRNDAEYVFYKPRPQSLPVEPLPVLSDGDALLFGSFYSLSADTRSRLVPLLSQSAKVDCVRYYDPNFRSSHLKDLDRLLPVILDNMRSADIVRGSDEDFRNIFGSDEFAGLSAELIPLLEGSVLARFLFVALELPTELRTSLWATVLERLLFAVPSDVLRFLEELPVTLSVSGSES
jgi:fructokinase